MKKFLLAVPILILGLAFVVYSNFTITGTVTDETGKPVSYASIVIKGTTRGTQADANGRFKINVNESDKELEFSALGYQRQSIKINKQSVINIVLAKSNQQMEEVVVTTTYQTKRVARAVSSNTQLVGKAAGLQTYGFYSPAPNADFNTEEYSNISENQFHRTGTDPLSTFSIDVDAASYSNIRRYLNEGQLPPAGAVRTEEIINYFKYNYPQPTNGEPFSINTEVADCPWNANHKIALIGLQGKKIPTEKLPPSNLTFLIDVSGSMSDENKLPLVKKSMKMLTDQLREQDMVSIVVYAGNAGLVLPPTSGSKKTTIKDAIDALESGGSTAGGAGIQLAYKVAQENFTKNGNNRVILCTDGDFNVGESSDDALVRLIEKEREKGIFLTVLGYGMGNYKDSKMQQLADKGNGNHAYIDGENEAKKVLVNEFGGTLFTIAKDVKLQLEFNPTTVAGYRLIGYENRMLNKEDFNDDKKDAGELGSGHTVTALYEIIPIGVESAFLKDVDKLKYQKEKLTANASGNDLFTVKFRYKEPDGDKSKLLEKVVINHAVAFGQASENLRFACSAAAFGMLLRNSEFITGYDYAKLKNIAQLSLGKDSEGYRKEFIGLIDIADKLKNSKALK